MKNQSKSMQQTHASSYITSRAASDRYPTPCSPLVVLTDVCVTPPGDELRDALQHGLPPLAAHFAVALPTQVHEQQVLVPLPWWMDDAGASAVVVAVRALGPCQTMVLTGVGAGKSTVLTNAGSSQAHRCHLKTFKSTRYIYASTAASNISCGELLSKHQPE